ncbi:MAG: DnaJ domain-containing protein [Clostridiales bacterium]|jgi:DnaJ-class molecular chaperone|nr:DnaJ domain-containing protein [Clostridiales bacterium]
MDIMLSNYNLDDYDYCFLLGLTPAASQDDIKRSYRRLATKHHPDNGGNIKVFTKLNEAYRTLGNATKCAEYDDALWVRRYTAEQTEQEQTAKHKAGSYAEPNNTCETRHGSGTGLGFPDVPDMFISGEMFFLEHRYKIQIRNEIIIFIY